MVGAGIANSGVYLESTPGPLAEVLEIGKQACSLHYHRCLRPLESEALWPSVNTWKKEAERAKLTGLLTSFSLCVVVSVFCVLATR